MYSMTDRATCLSSIHKIFSSNSSAISRFSSFVDLYEEVGYSVLADIEPKSVESLIRDCAYYSREGLYKILAGLQLDKRTALLELFFKSANCGETKRDIQYKAAIISKILGGAVNFNCDLKRLVDRTIPRSGWIYDSRPYSYREVLGCLDSLRGDRFLPKNRGIFGMGNFDIPQNQVRSLLSEGDVAL